MKKPRYIILHLIASIVIYSSVPFVEGREPPPKMCPCFNAYQIYGTCKRINTDSINFQVNEEPFRVIDCPRDPTDVPQWHYSVAAGFGRTCNAEITTQHGTVTIAAFSLGIMQYEACKAEIKRAACALDETYCTPNP